MHWAIVEGVVDVVSIAEFVGGFEELGRLALLSTGLANELGYIKGIWISDIEMSSQA